MLKHVWLPEYRQDQPPPMYSLAWFDRMIESPDTAFQRVPIGAHNVRYPKE
jgi:hypothetical protein